MSKIIDEAKELINLLRAGVSVKEVKLRLNILDESKWFRISAKAYRMHLTNARRQREDDILKENVFCTSNNQIKAIIALNEVLAEYALLLPTTATMEKFNQINNLILSKPVDQHKLIAIVKDYTMHPNARARQKKGRIEGIEIFKEFSKFIHAATISYYRENYISAYLTLIPLIEGMLLRWLNYKGIGEKPEFDHLRKFFTPTASHMRQPCPGNPLFHEVFIKACHKILNEHLFKPTTTGKAFSNFNRHLAAHLLNDTEFATQDNCVRLFLLIDTMTEIYLYEEYYPDHRFYLKEDDISIDRNAYNFLILTQHFDSPEKSILK